MPGLHAQRRSDGLWVPVEEAPARQDGALVMLVMAGDTLGYLTKQYYAPSKHRVTAPPRGERIGLPFLFRGRSDAVLNTLPAVEAGKARCRSPRHPHHPRDTSPPFASAPLAWRKLGRKQRHLGAPRASPPPRGPWIR